MKETELKLIPVSNLLTLKRNPQYLTPKQMESLKKSIERDGFCVPILVRPLDEEKYEVISGNHRFMAGCEVGLSEIPCVVSNMSEGSAKRLAVNLNTIHGEPNAELLAPFLCELDPEILKEIYIEDTMKDELLKFDKTLENMLKNMEAPDKVNRDSPKHSNKICKCEKCGRKHFENEE